MNDTPPQIMAKMEEMLRRKSPSERLRMGCSMFEMARRLVRSSILQKEPHTASSTLRKELFLRFYGDDFAPGRRQKVIQYLTENTEKSTAQSQ